MNVGQNPVAQKGIPVEFHSQLMTDSAVGPIAADQPLSLCGLFRSIGMHECADYSVGAGVKLL